MNSSNCRCQAAPSPADQRSNSATFASIDVCRNIAEPSGYAVAVGRSVFRYSRPRRWSSSPSSAYAAEPVKSGCQELITSWVKPGSV